MKTLNPIKYTGACLRHLALAVGLGLGLTAGTALAAPANDDFANAIDLTGAGSGQTGSVTTGTQTGTDTAAATLQAGESDPGASNTVWFKWTSPGDGEFTYYTNGSTNSGATEWDAIIGIYTGTAVNALTPLDGTPLDTALDETMTVTVTAGTTYHIQLAGYADEAAANIKFNWNFVATIYQADILSFGPGATIGAVFANAANISWTVPFGTNLATLAPIFTLSSGTCDKISGGTYDFTNPVVYTVTDGATVNNYTVTTSATPGSPANDILSFDFGTLGVATIIDTEISLTVPNGSNVTGLAPTYTVSPLATGSPVSGTVRNFTTPQTYTVTAQDGSTKNYAVTVNQTTPAAITNIRAAQRAGTNLVDIDYDVTGTAQLLKISLEVSDDDGSTFQIPATALSGAAGANVTPSLNLRMIWDAGKDWGGHDSANMRFKVVADDTPIPVPPGFALIPAGPFQMGDQSNPLVGSSNELPVHPVQVSAFYMAKYEVTKELWDDVRTWGLANGYTDLAVGNGGYASKGANHPVHSITWYDMVKWCNARSEKEGLLPSYRVSGALYKSGQSDEVVCNWSADGYRLPTETEWEKAARGGLSGKNFPWGDTISQSQANYRVYSSDEITNYYSYDVTPRPPATGTDYFHSSYTAGGGSYSAPVDSFAPNGYGLYNMAGNVWEWCWEWYGSYAAEAQTDPHGATSGSYRVFRGGSWNDTANLCRVTYRYTYNSNGSSSNVGFRIVRRSIP